MEILSPAGDFNALKAAVQNGADAVYAGGESFSARSSAKNFDNDTLLRAVDYCHLRGVKLYITINTLILENELADACRFLEYIRKIGADAAIIQDLGLLKLLAENRFDLPLHASTQMTVMSDFAVRYLKKYNIKRVVLARELSFDEISEIANNTDAELEVFVHGALCMSYSGQCLFSSIIGGRSGNRGSCAQPCRLPYSLMNGDKNVSRTMPLLSPKDICLVSELKKLDKIGIASLKIEGRMKSAEYVAAATRVYSAAIKEDADQKEIDKMLSLFSRGGQCRGYFYGRQFDKMMNYDTAAKISADKELISETKKSFSGENIKTEINMFFEARHSQEAKLTIYDNDGRSVTVSEDICSKADGVNTDSKRIEQQLNKLGSTPFKAEYTEIICDDGIAMHVKDINELRRRAVEALSDDICSSYRKLPQTIEIPKYSPAVSREKRLSVEVTTLQQLKAVRHIDDIDIFIPYSLYRSADMSDAVFVLPPILKTKDVPDLQDIESVEINNIGQAALCQGKKIYGGYALNIFNSAAARALKDVGLCRATLSAELNIGDINKVLNNCSFPLDVLAYGRQRLMYMENCVIKSSYGCKCSEGSFFLKDRKGVKFPIITENCRNILLNSRPVYMADKIEDIKNLQIRGLRLIFTVEKPDLCCIIIDEYKRALEGKSIKSTPTEYTRGHFYRGIQ